MAELKSKIQRYKAYKDSGVEWLGEIPEHWQANKLKYVLIEINERSKTGKEELLSLSKTKGVIPKSTLGDRSGQANSLIGYKKVYIKSLVINKMQAVNGLLSVSRINGITSPDYSIYKTLKDNDINYFGYLLNQPVYLDEFKKVVTGVMEGFIRLYTDDLYNIKAHIPPLQEQIKIAEFLDDKTTKIDQAIAIKQQQIGLLKERKQILIHKAVTQGINPNVKLKNSDVDWIGEIPEHWEVKRIKHIANIQGGFAFNSGDFTDQGVQIIKIANTYMNKLSLDRQPTFVNKSYLTSHKDWVVSKNDILISLTGTLGKKDYGFAILIENNERYLLNQRVAKVTVKDGFEPEYLIHLLRSDSYLNQLYCLPSGTKQANLSNDNVINITMPIPPLKERMKISEYIKTSSNKIETAISLKQQEITKLKEYKSSLINSVVTGKVKVC